MKVKAMIKQNNALREQMTPFNRSYYEDMLLGLRASKVDPVRTEELLLEAAALLLEGQGKGKNAKQIFGEHPEDYFKEIAGSAPARKVRSKLNYYLMIPWAALTGLFSVYAISGLLLLWSTGEAGMFGQISIFTILAVGAGSIVLIEIIMKWLSSLSEDDAPKPKPFDIKGLGIYVGIAIIVVFLGIFLDNLFPVISLSPWVSLVVAVAGGLGLKFIFFKS
ncbi:DUF1129 family protein [Paenibacillus jilunlii]|uniref:Uncharacterized membrane-anchored protein n=1 Tax=Paenibacillus jilunlii TaxID=682956 RepID=A0A1G9WE86_9BACL|nr:DUF1129 family protein [Paenibacillus jilunlii]KWX73489.1 hypothetical protein AML91_17560 [Paenibacillus jilunlii]SDM82561.1 Uncharacterized membrane-anchored protein [Paenibacillus jilunlii]